MSGTTKTKSVKPKSAEHPKYIDMIVAAISALKDRKGSSRQAIIKYINANYKVSESSAVHIKTALRRGVVSSDLIQAKGTGASGSFKVAPKKVAAPKPKKTTTTKPKSTAAGKKKTASKSTPKKKSATKTKKPTPKKSATKKPAAKKTAAKKPAAKKPAAKKTKTPTKKKTAKKTSKK